MGFNVRRGTTRAQGSASLEEIRLAAHLGLQTADSSRDRQEAATVEGAADGPFTGFGSTRPSVGSMVDGPSTTASATSTHAARHRSIPAARRTGRPRVLFMAWLVNSSAVDDSTLVAHGACRELPEPY